MSAVEDANRRFRIVERSEKIADEILDERLRAARAGYDLQHDLDHGGPDHMIAYAHTYLQKAHTIYYRTAPEDRRENLVKAAGLIIAAIDAHDHIEIQRQDEAIERGG